MSWTLDARYKFGLLGHQGVTYDNYGGGGMAGRLHVAAGWRAVAEADRRRAMAKAAKEAAKRATCSALGRWLATMVGEYEVLLSRLSAAAGAAAVGENLNDGDDLAALAGEDVASVGQRLEDCEIRLAQLLAMCEDMGCPLPPRGA
jgi:hypothetical protein